MRRIPVALLVPAVVALAFLTLPVVALFTRVAVVDLPSRLREPLVLDALRLSVVTSTISTLLCVVLGVPLAWVIARRGLRLRQLLRILVVLPLVLPPVAGGISLLVLLGRNGLVGRMLASVGVSLPFTTAGTIVAQTFVALPFLVLAAEGAFRNVDQRLEDVAASLGASQLRVFRRVTVPVAAPGIVAGVVLAWARALGEFGATITFAGSLPGRTETLPLALYRALEQSTEAAISVGLVLLAFSIAVLLLLRERWWTLS